MDIKNPFDIHNPDHANKVAEVAGYPGAFDRMKAIDDDPENPIDYHEMLSDRESLGWNEQSRKSDFWAKHKLQHPNSQYDIINKLIQ